MFRALRASIVAATLAVVTAVPCALAGDEPTPAEPFPFAKTTILRDEHASYYVEGRVRIPKGVEVTVLRGIRITGRGKDATIEVEGSLKIHGVHEREVILDGVTIQPCQVFDEIKIDMTAFTKGSGLRTAKDVPCTGYFMLELLDLDKTSAVDLALKAGSVEMATVCSESPVRIRAVDTPGEKGNTVRVEVRGCEQESLLKCPIHQGVRGLVGGLDVEGANEVVVRLSRLGGDRVRIADWRRSLIFDGNKVDAKTLAFEQPVAGRYRVAQFLKCDVSSTSVRFAAPVEEPGETEEFPVERWWFARTKSDRAEIEKLVDDAADAPGRNGARAKIGKLNERPLELAGTQPDGVK